MDCEANFSNMKCANTWPRLSDAADFFSRAQPTVSKWSGSIYSRQIYRRRQDIDLMSAHANHLNSSTAGRARAAHHAAQIQLPKWLHIAKVSDEHYRVIDTSVDS